MPRAATTIAFAGMRRVEVLKGPQGTLFGRNAAVGVINMMPNASTNSLQGFARARLGNNDLVRAEAMINLTVTDGLFLRANILNNQRGGLVKQLGPTEHNPGEQDHQTARLAMLWEASETTRAQLSCDWDKLDNAPGMSIGYSEYAYSLDPFSAQTTAMKIPIRRRGCRGWRIP